MKAKDLREKSPDELQAALLEERKAQFALRMQKATGQLSETHKIKQVRRNVARIKTVLSQKSGQ